MITLRHILISMLSLFLAGVCLWQQGNFPVSSTGSAIASGSGPATGTPGAGSVYVNNSTGQIYTNNNGSFNLQSPYPVYPGLLSFGTSLSNPCNGVGTLLTVQC
jgi:hypothetical protein